MIKICGIMLYFILMNTFYKYNNTRQVYTIKIKKNYVRIKEDE